MMMMHRLPRVKSKRRNNNIMENIEIKTEIDSKGLKMVFCAGTMHKTQIDLWFVVGRLVAAR